VIVSLVAAVAENGVIGRAGALPWSLPADLRRFRELTTGHHVVMGRKTHASIGRALPDRANLVLTRRPELVAAGCRAVPDLDAALRIARDAGESEAFVIGGAALYALALPLATRIYLTRVAARVDGDVHFPELDAARWQEVSRELRAPDERNAHPLAFTLLQAAAGRASPARRPG
jgi:dihydrofolate reductase